MIIFRLNYTQRAAVGPFPGEAGYRGQGHVPQPHSQDPVLELKGLGTAVQLWCSEASRRLDLLAPPPAPVQGWALPDPGWLLLPGHSFGALLCRHGDGQHSDSGV